MVTETEYQQLSAVLDDLIYGVGEDENHPLSAAMTLVGILIKAYEDEHFPKLTDLFPELAEDWLKSSKVQIPLLPYLDRSTQISLSFSFRLAAFFGKAAKQKRLFLPMTWQSV